MMNRKLLVFVLLLVVAPCTATAQTDSSSGAQAQQEMPRITEKEVRAVQQALFSRGILTRQPNGVLDAATRTALTEFQKREGLAETGKIDQPTIDKLGLTFPITDDNEKSKRKNGVLPKVGYAVKDGASTTSKAVTGSAKKVGGGTKSGAKKAADVSTDGVKAAGGKSVEGAKTAGQAVQKTSTDVATATVGRSDDSIHKDVRELLNKTDITRNLISEVKEGRVTLTSSGPTEGELADTLNKIRKISGVKSVELVNK
jgi:hypothetical protein